MSESTNGKGSRYYWQGRGPVVRLNLLEGTPGLAVAAVWAQGAYLLDLGRLPDLISPAAQGRPPTFLRTDGKGGRSRKGGRGGKGGKGKGAGVGSAESLSRLRELKVLRRFPGISPSRLSVDSHSSTLMVSSSDGQMCRVLAALSGACLFEVPASSAGSLVACMAPAPQVQDLASPKRITGARCAWWSAAWWSAHEHDGGVSFSRAAWPLQTD